MRVWITKYALTMGIMEREGRKCDHGDMIEYDNHCYVHGLGKEYHLSLADALKHADKMRALRLASIDKSRQKLVTMKFKIV